MGYFAIIESGIVTNLIVAETLEDAESVTGKTCAEYTLTNPAHIGLGYNGSVFEQPAITEERIMQFTQEEWESYINDPLRETEESPLFTNPQIIEE